MAITFNGILRLRDPEDESNKSSETSGSTRVLFHKTCILRAAAWAVVPKRCEHETAASHIGRSRRLLNHFTSLTWSFVCPTIIRNILITIIYTRISQYRTCKQCNISPLKTKRRPLYLKPQSVPRCKHFKHFSSRLQKAIRLWCKWYKSLFVLR
jgi:hypothetical protein